MDPASQEVSSRSTPHPSFCICCSSSSPLTAFPIPENILPILHSYPAHLAPFSSTMPHFAQRSPHAEAVYPGPSPTSIYLQASQGASLYIPQSHIRALLVVSASLFDCTFVYSVCMQAEKVANPACKQMWTCIHAFCCSFASSNYQKPLGVGNYSPALQMHVTPHKGAAP